MADPLAALGTLTAGDPITVAQINANDTALAGVLAGTVDPTANVPKARSAITVGVRRFDVSTWFWVSKMPVAATLRRVRVSLDGYLGTPGTDMLTVTVAKADSILGPWTTMVVPVITKPALAEAPTPPAIGSYWYVESYAGEALNLVLTANQFIRASVDIAGAGPWWTTVLLDLEVAHVST